MAYLGEKFGLMGRDAAERAMVDQLLCEVMDLRNDAIALFYGNQITFTELSNPDNDAAAYLDEVVAPHYAKLESWLALKGTPYLAGGSPTAPDFHLWEMLDQHTLFATDYEMADPLADCPCLTSFAARFSALPQLAGYFSGPLHSLPCNNKGALWGGL